MNKNHNLVTISAEQHDLILELAYATENNFTGKTIYGQPICLLHQEAADRLFRAVDIIKPLGLRLKIWDGFRPVEAQQLLFNHTPDPTYVSDPASGTCPHCRGVAIDLTLTDIHDNELPMGTDFDDFRPLAHHGNDLISTEAQRNRLLLAGIMNIVGFDSIDSEWWHYQLPNAYDYPMLKEAELKSGIL